MKLPALTPLHLHLEGIVRCSIRELRKELGETWVPNSIFGTELHRIVSRNVASIVSPIGWVINVERPIKHILKMKSDIIGMTIDECISNAPWKEGPLYDLAMYRPELQRIFKDLRKPIGDLRPDLVIQDPSGDLTIWDLTSREHAEHVCKTLFYARLLTRVGTMAHIGETYWYQPTGF